MIIGEKTIDAKIKSISEGMSFIKDALSDAKVTSKDSNKAQLVAEEFLAHIISAKAEEDSTTIRIVVTKRGRGCKILISFAGKKIDNLENVGLGVDLSEGEMSPDTEAVIRKTIISALEDKYSVGYRNGVNKITITVGEAGKNEAMVTAGAFILAIIVGLILRLLVPADISSAINKNVFEIIKTIFLNALKLITGPVVFLAIASCVSTFSDMKELG